MMEIKLEARKILLADKAVDFRKAIDGLCTLIVEDMQANPTQGIYVFYNKRRGKIKILGWHGSGFILLYKRLEKGKFTITVNRDKIQLSNDQLNWLLAGLNWELLSNWGDSKISAFF